MGGIKDFEGSSMVFGELELENARFRFRDGWIQDYLSETSVELNKLTSARSLMLTETARDDSDEREKEKVVNATCQWSRILYLLMTHHLPTNSRQP